MEDTWTNRDLPVLRAAVQIYEETGHPKIRASHIDRVLGFDKETTQRAIRALYTEPYFEAGTQAFGGETLSVGAPTSAALRVAGQWPTPENMVERLVAALQAASEDENVPEPERGKAKQAAMWLGDTLSKIAIGALGGAGGHMLSG